MYPRRDVSGMRFFNLILVDELPHQRQVNARPSLDFLCNLNLKTWVLLHRLHARNSQLQSKSTGKF
jgi:hypothetical protein